jgi:hypothetical protein
VAPNICSVRPAAYAPRGMGKVCLKCRQHLPLSEFHRYRDGYQSWCKACKSTYAAEYYVRNRAKRVEYNRRQRQEASAFYLELKTGQPCSDCGEVFHPAAMQWDHLPGVDKVADVAELYRGSRARVLKEIEKCELVCANCHAVRTHNRRQATVAGASAVARTYPDGEPP